jgi:hypothetical protein
MLARIPERRALMNIMPPAMPGMPDILVTGMDPKAISDPAARAVYERRIAENHRAMEENTARWRLGASYATNGLIVWSGNSGWWIIVTAESFNGDRATYEGNVETWFATNAWGGVNYSNTPVGAVSNVEEPGETGINGPTYMSLWDEGFLFSECAWASKLTPCFQAIGDPLIKQ